MLALQALVGPFKAVGSIFEKQIPGPSAIIDAGLAWSTVGPFGDIDTAFPCSGRPIRSSRKHSRIKTTGPTREGRCWLCRLWWAHSKQSEAYSRNKYWAHPRSSMPALHGPQWAHSGTSIPLFHAPAGRFEVVESILGLKLLDPPVRLHAGFAGSGGPIQSSRKHIRETNTGPIRDHRCQPCMVHSGPIRERRYRLSMLRWAHSKQSETISPGPIRKHRGWLWALRRAHSKQS